MLRTIEAVIEPDGRVRLLESVELPAARRAPVLDEPGGEASDISSALLSEQALSGWNREEEDAARAHVQQAP